MTKIEWTKNTDGSQGKTWNPTVGCSRKSDGCMNCYAEVMTKRLALIGNENYKGLLNEQNRFNGVLRLNSDNLLKPLSIKKPTTFFVNSMSDLFHENVEVDWIDKVFAVMALTPQHTYQILTKRADKMRDYFSDKKVRKYELVRYARNLPVEEKNKISYARKLNISYHYPDLTLAPLPNVHLGVSVENQKEKYRIDLLRQTPASIRFLSLEPLLEDLGELDLTDISWCIVGGESGTNARPFNWDWARNIKAQCEKANVKFFMKQGGKNGNKNYKDFESFPPDLQIREIINS